MSSGEEDDLAAALAFLDAYEPFEVHGDGSVVPPANVGDSGPVDFLYRLDKASEARRMLEQAPTIAQAANAASADAPTSSLSPPSAGIASADNRGDSSRRAKSRGAASKRQRPPAYNSNHARQEKHRELLVLRTQERELTQTLAVLQTRSRYHGQPTARPHGRHHEIAGSTGGVSIDAVASAQGSTRHTETEAAARQAAVWQEIAKRQLEHRTVAESEQRRLKWMLEMQEKLLAELENLVFSKATVKAMDAAAGGNAPPHPLVHAVQHFDAVEFGPIMHQVEESYRGIDRVFQRDVGDTRSKSRRGHMRMDADGHLFFEIFGSKIFPFDVETTGDAAWKRFSYSVRPNDANIFSKFFDAPVDTIAELFATELRLNKDTAVILPRQVKRLYKEQDRVAIVWQSHVDAVEFMGRSLSGAEYQENGYFLIERPPYSPEGFAELRTCYIIAPTVPTHLVPQDSVAFALMKFMFKWMASTIPANHQILEDMLILHSSRCVGANAVEG